jgi:hypothetical protein
MKEMRKEDRDSRAPEAGKHMYMVGEAEESGAFIGEF